MKDELGTGPGLLVAFEGPDGSGKTTQRKLLKDWLMSRNEPATVTKGSSSPRFKPVIKARKAARSLTPEEYATLHALDFRERYTREILPALSDGQTVLADGYVFTDLARDIARGLDRDWSMKLYQPVRWPDLTLYFSASTQTCAERIALSRKPKYYEAGQDVTGINDPLESHRVFTEQVVAEYSRLSQSFLFIVVNAEKDIYAQHEFIRNIYEASQSLGVLCAPDEAKNTVLSAAS